jgi:diguanylate cyclase (GGDEF)-like protein
VECAERIRKAIEETVCPGVDRRITVSVGATLFAADDTEESLIKRADTALYNAKASGRNRVVLKYYPEAATDDALLLLVTPCHLSHMTYHP